MEEYGFEADGGPDPGQTYDINEAAAFLKLAPGSVYNLCAAGKLAHFKPGGRRIIFTRADLEAYLFRNRVPSSAELSNMADDILLGRSGGGANPDALQSAITRLDRKIAKQFEDIEARLRDNAAYVRALLAQRPELKIENGGKG
jgi:excisionase family DNA binding protein